MPFICKIISDLGFSETADTWIEILIYVKIKSHIYWLRKIIDLPRKG